MKTRDLTNVVMAALSGIKANTKEGQNLLFKDGVLYAWSAAIFVSAKLPKDAVNLSGIVNGEDLAKFLNKLNKTDIAIECNDDEWIVTSDTMTAKLMTRQDNNITNHIDFDNNLTWHKLPANFYDALAICDIPNNTKKTAGVFMKHNLMVSTDNIRVNRVELDSDISDGVWIAQFSVSEIRRLKLQFKEYSVSDRWIHFRSDVDENGVQLEFACNRLNDTDYQYKVFASFIDKAKDAIFAKGELPDLTQALSVASCFDDNVELGDSSVLSNIISLTFDKKYLTVSSERAKSGNYKEKLKYPDDKELDIEAPFKVKVTSFFLMEASKYSKHFGLAKVGKNTVIVFSGAYFASAVMVLV